MNRPNRASASASASLFAVLIGLLILPACQSTPKNTAPSYDSSTALSFDAITRDYEARRYTQSLAAAQSLYNRSTGPQRQHAAYLAGLSAFQLHKNADAARYLNQSTLSTDPQIAGRSWATLGLIHFNEKDFRQSVAAFKNATGRLTGQNKANAAYHCAQAHQELNQHSQARLQLQVARSASTDADFIAQIDRELRATGYTLQIGAFNHRKNAENLAATYDSSPQAIRFGQPRVVEDADPAGRPMYCVRIGTFNSFQSASRAVSDFNIPAFVRPMSSASRN